MISVIAAIGKNRELGKNNKLLWDIPEDMEHFRSKTKGHTVIMGRKTYESIGHPLPGRPNIVITNDPSFQAQGSMIASSLAKAIEIALEKKDPEIFIIGGASIYAQAMDLADKLYLTVVHQTFPDADTFFPDYSKFSKELSKKDSAGNGYTYTFLELVGK